jgi:hypothetical protein
MTKKKFPQKKMALTTQSVDLKSAILHALEDERYDWRTVGGLASALKVGEREVFSVLNSMPDQIVRTTHSDGRNLFTTRSHYQKTHGFQSRLLSALADRVVA